MILMNKKSQFPWVPQSAGGDVIVNGISIRIHQSDAYTVNVALNVAVVHDLSKKSRGNVIIVI